MKLDRLETHDRFLIAKKEENVIQKGFDECRFKNELTQQLFQYSNYVYIFAHKRTIEADEKAQMYNKDSYESIVNPNYTRKYHTMDDMPSFRIIWQPRLTKPEAQTNSYLFRCERDNLDVEVYWILPPDEFFGQNEKGNMMEDPIITESVALYLNDRQKLSDPHKNDLPLEKVKEIYELICSQKKFREFKPILEI